LYHTFFFSVFFSRHIYDIFFDLFSKISKYFFVPTPLSYKKRNDTYIIITVGFLQVRKSVANFLPKILFECVVFAYSPGFTRLLLQNARDSSKNNYD